MQKVRERDDFRFPGSTREHNRSNLDSFHHNPFAKGTTSACDDGRSSRSRDIFHHNPFAKGRESTREGGRSNPDSYHHNPFAKISGSRRDVGRSNPDTCHHNPFAKGRGLMCDDDRSNPATFHYNPFAEEGVEGKMFVGQSYAGPPLPAPWDVMPKSPQETALKKSRSHNSLQKWWKDRGLKQKRRFLRYEMYAAEAKVKHSLKKGFHWVKSTCKKIAGR